MKSFTNVNYSRKNRYKSLESNSIEGKLSCITFSKEKFKNFNSQYSELLKLERRLMSARDSMEPYFKMHKKYFSSITSNFESFKKTRFHISERFNTPSVSNSWIVMYEIISRYKLIPEKKVQNNLWIHFNSENLPCDYILPIYHYVHTMCDDNMQNSYRWLNSFPINNAEYKGKDLYKISSRYQTNTLTDYNNSNLFRDASGITYLDSVYSNFTVKMEEFNCEKGVDLFTGGITINTRGKYNEEEFLNNKSFAAQLYLCFKVLSKNGNAVFKKNTFFTKFNISLLAWMRNYFEELYLYKPESSKMDSGETFMICKKFRGIETGSLNTLRNILADKKFDFKNGTIIQINYLSSKFWNELVSISQQLFSRQITAIENKIYNFNCITHGMRLDDEHISNYKKLQNESRGIFKSKSDRDNESWYKKYTINVLYMTKWLSINNITKTYSHELIKRKNIR